MLDEKIREHRLGGSEIAAIPPWRVHTFLTEFGLWLRKKGDLPRMEPSDRMRLGKHLEQGIASYAAELEGWEYEWCDTTSRSEIYPFMVYTPDALIPKKRWGIDCKLVGWDQAHKWGRSADGVPDHAVMQAWWYTAALDYDGWYVAALVMGEDRPRIYPIPRNSRAEAVMLRRAREWWERYLVGDERPPVTASEYTDTWLKKNWPRERNANNIVPASDEEIELLEQYAVVRREYTEVDGERKDLEARLKTLIGDRAGLRWSGGKFTWKVTKDSIQTDWEALANVLVPSHPAGEKLLEEFTHPKPGVRRIYFKDARGDEVEL
jgi:predicted phage-related endonuclease